MKISPEKPLQRRARFCGRAGGFTLIEGMVGFAVFAISFAALLTGLTTNVSTVKYARETVRATQIMEEKLDTIRLYTWDQLNTAGYVPSPFYAPFYPSTALSGAQVPGVTYTGVVTMAVAPITEGYKSNLVQITVDLYWPSHPKVSHAQMSTYVAKYGLQSYIY